MVDFGTRLRKLRVNKGLTQAQLAERLGLTKSVISAYERDVRLPTYDTLISITRIFNVTSDYLLGIEKKSEIDVSGLGDREVNALKTLISALKG